MTRRRSPILLAFCLIAALLACAPVAAAADKHGPKHHAKKASTHTSTKPSDQSNAIINDCQNHGQLTKTYSKAQLRHALAIMSPATKQYSNCFDVIHQALIHGVKTNGKGSSKSSGGGSFLPTPVIIVIVVLVLAAVTFAGMAIRRRRSGISDDEDGPDRA